MSHDQVEKEMAEKHLNPGLHTEKNAQFHIHTPLISYASYQEAVKSYYENVKYLLPLVLPEMKAQYCFSHVPVLLDILRKTYHLS